MRGQMESTLQWRHCKVTEEEDDSGMPIKGIHEERNMDGKRQAQL